MKEKIRTIPNTNAVTKLNTYMLKIEQWRISIGQLSHSGDLKQTEHYLKDVYILGPSVEARILHFYRKQRCWMCTEFLVRDFWQYNSFDWLKSFLFSCLYVLGLPACPSFAWTWHRQTLTVKINIYILETQVLFTIDELLGHNYENLQRANGEMVLNI